MPSLPYPALFAGHDAGAHTLPADLLHARDTYLKVEALPYPQPPRNAWETVGDFAAALVEAVHHGTELPDPAMIEAARTAERVYQDALDAADMALNLAANRVRNAVNIADIITSHLAPAHDETWQTVKDAHRTLAEHGETEHKRLLTAPSKVRKAADTLDRAVERYTLVRGGYAAFNLRCPEDPTGKYSSVRNFHTLFPVRLAMGRPPWHGLDTRQYLVWMAEHGGQLWMPTLDQQAEAVEAEAHIGNPRRLPAAARHF